MITRLGSSLMSLVGAAMLALPVVTVAPAFAQADATIRVGGAITVTNGHQSRSRARHRHHHHHHGHWHRPYVRLHLGGIGFGVVGYSLPPPPPPPPPPCEHACEPVVRSYAAPPGPAIVGPPSTVAPAIAPHRRERPAAFGLGAFTGSVATGDGGDEAADSGLIARLRLSRSIELEGELGKSRVDARSRTDKRLGGALLYHLRPYSRLNLFLLAGAGFAQANFGGGALVQDQSYAEVGGGVGLRLGRRLQLAVDVRAGTRATMADDSPGANGVSARLVSVPGAASEEDYTRGRLSAVLYF